MPSFSNAIHQRPDLHAEGAGLDIITVGDRGGHCDLGIGLADGRAVHFTVVGDDRFVGGGPGDGRAIRPPAPAGTISR